MLEITITNFDRPNWTFRNDLHDRISKNRVITIGRVPIAQENFYWAAITGHYLFDTTVNFIHENKLEFKGKFIAKTLEHTIGFKDSTKLTITYCKSMDNSGFSGNETWTNMALYTDDQKYFVQKFLDEAKSVFLMTSKEAALSASKKQPVLQPPAVEILSNQLQFDFETELKKLDKMKEDQFITNDEYMLLREGLIKKAANS